MKFHFGHVFPLLLRNLMFIIFPRCFAELYIKVKNTKTVFHDTIGKLEIKIRLWKTKNLTMDGKSLIIKTFGISQLIYVLQPYEIMYEV